MKNSKLMMNTAISVCFAVTSLFCGLTVARAQEPDNRIDWRWGRPGVMVVTNAPTAVTVTNIATDVASGVANTMFGPRVTALEGTLDGGTNNWDTAYGWGDHAAVGYLLPADLAPYATTQQVEVAAAALAVHTNRADNPHGVTAAQIGAITAEVDPVAGPRLDLIEPETNKWNAAYGWGDHALAGYLLPADLAPYATTQQVAAAVAPLATTQQVVSLTHRVTGLEGSSNDWSKTVSNLAGLSNNVANLSSRVDATNNLFSAWFSGLQSRTSYWDTAYSWGDHAAVGYLLPADLAPYATTQQVEVAAAALAVHTNRADNPHGVTAAQIGALTAEQDLVALAADRFLPIDAGKNVISTDAGSGSIVTYSALIGDRAGNSITGANVIAIGRDAARKAILATGEEEADVIAIGENAAEEAGQLYAVSNVIAIGDSAFKGASGVRAIAIGDDAGFAADMQYGIAVGQFAGYGATLVNSIVIGTGAGSQSSLANSVVIGPSAGEKATGDGMLFIDGSGHGVTDHPEYAMIYGSNVNLTLGKGDAWPYSTNVLRGNWLFNNNQILTNELDLAALRTYHYGSPDIVESPAEWFVFDGAGTITGFNWAAGRENVVIPWAIGGVPVTAIGASAFRNLVTYQGHPVVSVVAPQTVTAIGGSAFDSCHSLTSVIAPQATAIGGSAFAYCTALESIDLPHVTSIGGYTFAYCNVLASAVIPQVASIGFSAFSGCLALNSINLPQVTTVEEYAFYNCTSLTAVHMGQNAPAEAADVFADINPSPTVHVTDPQATGWGAAWNGSPVVRPPLYGSNVTAQAFTLGGDTITEWPSGGETSIIAPLYESGTNVTVTSTQSVYSVSVTGAGPVGIDWSGLSLDGTGRAEITLRINVTDWGGTNVTFSPSLTFDQQPEILVTGVWEFAASTIDGVTTRVRQTWPECDRWRETPCTMNQVYSQVSALFKAKQWATCTAIGVTNYLTYLLPANDSYLIRNRTYGNGPNIPPTYMEYLVIKRGHHHFSERTLIYTTTKLTETFTPRVTESYFVFPADPASKFFELALVTGEPFASSGSGSLFTDCTYVRRLNSNERAAYEAGWRP